MGDGRTTVFVVWLTASRRPPYSGTKSASILYCNVLPTAFGIPLHEKQFCVKVKNISYVFCVWPCFCWWWCYMMLLVWLLLGILPLRCYFEAAWWTLHGWCFFAVWLLHIFLSLSLLFLSVIVDSCFCPLVVLIPRGFGLNVNSAPLDWNKWMSASAE